MFVIQWFMGWLFSKNSKMIEWRRWFPTHIFNRVLEKLEGKDVELVATIVIRIWIRRNTLLFGGDLTHHSQLVRSAKESVGDFWRDAQNMRNNFEQERAIWWSRNGLTASWGNIDELDASIDISTKKIGIHTIVRDHNGNVLASMCSSKPYITYLTIAEAFASWKVM